jgi:lysophospholipase L1-like esterase
MFLGFVLIAGGILQPLYSGGVAAKPTVRIMALGDSITEGYRSSDLTGYRGPLKELLIRDGVNPVISDRSKGGETIRWFAERVDGWLATDRPDVVLLDAGTNDAVQPDDIPNAGRRIAALVDRILASDPRVSVVVAKLQYMNNPAGRANQRKINGQIPPVAAARAGRVYIADMSTLPPTMLDDGIHPNDAGYREMAARWHAALRPILRVV